MLTGIFSWRNKLLKASSENWYRKFQNLIHHNYWYRAHIPRRYGLISFNQMWRPYSKFFMRLNFHVPIRSVDVWVWIYSNWKIERRFVIPPKRSLVHHRRWNTRHHIFCSYSYYNKCISRVMNVNKVYDELHVNLLSLLFYLRVHLPFHRHVVLVPSTTAIVTNTNVRSPFHIFTHFLFTASIFFSLSPAPFIPSVYCNKE